MISILALNQRHGTSFCWSIRICIVLYAGFGFGVVVGRILDDTGITDDEGDGETNIDVDADEFVDIDGDGNADEFVGIDEDGDGDVMLTSLLALMKMEMVMVTLTSLLALT